MVEGGMKCIKYMLFGFNLIFFLAGLGLIICGAVVEAKFKDYLTFFAGSSFNSVAILLIAIGCIVFIIGFFGCCGAVKENYCMVMTFAVLMGLIFVLEIGAGIAGFVLKGKVERQLRKTMSKTLPNYSNKGVKKAWDYVQTELKCCGVDGPNDWKNTSTGTPTSCCIKNKNKTSCLTEKNNTYKKGCVEELKGWLAGNIYVVAGVGVGLAFIQVIGVIFACCLARSIKKEYEVV